MSNQSSDAPAGQGDAPVQTNTDVVPPDTPNSGENICRRCAGTGKVDDASCPECKGSGKVITPIGGAG